MKLHRTIIGAAVGFMALLLPFSGKAMTVLPPLFEYNVNKGAVLKDYIKLYNEGDTTLTLYPEVMNFSAKEERIGAPDFYSRNEVRTGHELAPWVTLGAKSLTLGPKQWGNLEFTVSVPANADPGGYYGGVIVSSSPPGGSGVGLVGGTGVLIILSVSGEVREDFRITDFVPTQSVYSHLPATLSMRFENLGTVHEKPVGNIFIRNIFGRQVASLPVNQDFRNVLPGSGRIFQNVWEKYTLPPEASEFMQQWKNFAFGPYTAIAVVNYGKGMTLTSSTTFWVIPWMVLILDLLILVLLVLLAKFAVGRYNNWLIERYRQGKMKAGKK